MIWMAATTTMPATAGAHRSEFHWGQTPRGASAAYCQPAYDQTTPDTHAVLTGESDEPADTLPLRFETHDQWDQADEKRFRQLVARSATDTISVEEKAELDSMMVTRRRLLCPMTIDQVRFEYQRRQAVQAALRAFDEYFRLLKAPHRTHA